MTVDVFKDDGYWSVVKKAEVLGIESDDNLQLFWTREALLRSQMIGPLLSTNKRCMLAQTSSNWVWLYYIVGNPKAKV